MLNSSGWPKCRQQSHVRAPGVILLLYADMTQLPINFPSSISLSSWDALL